MDSTAVTIIGIGAAAAPLSIFIDALKDQLERSLIKPTAAYHDSAIRLMAALVGICFAVVIAALQQPITGPAVLNSLIVGTAAGVAAMAYYHAAPSASNSGKVVATTADLHQVIDDHLGTQLDQTRAIVGQVLDNYEVVTAQLEKIQRALPPTAQGIVTPPTPVDPPKPVE